MRVLLIGHSGDMYGASRSLVKLTRILSKEHLVYVMLPEQGQLYDVLKSVIPSDRILIYSDLYIFTRKSFKLRYLLNTMIKFIKNFVKISSVVHNLSIDIVHTNS